MKSRSLELRPAGLLLLGSRLFNRHKSGIAVRVSRSDGDKTNSQARQTTRAASNLHLLPYISINERRNQVLAKGYRAASHLPAEALRPWELLHQQQRRRAPQATIR